jgi:hypothetical protein
VSAIATKETKSSAGKIGLDSLEFVRLKIPRLIPRPLIESVKGRTFTPEQFYVYQEAQTGNPNNFLYALVDPDRKIHGYLWAESNILDNTLFVNTFSVSKEFWGKGRAIDKAVAFVRTLQDKTKAPATLWITSNAKFFAKHGFRPSKSVLMEYRVPVASSDLEEHYQSSLVSPK